MTEKFNREKLDRIVANAHAQRDKASLGYRQQALKMYPWVCGRCAREFSRENLSQLTVHHRDHDHDNNPPDGSNWELLCIYCHDNEHARHADYVKGGEYGHGKSKSSDETYHPFAGLKSLLGKGEAE